MYRIRGEAHFYASYFRLRVFKLGAFTICKDFPKVHAHECLKKINLQIFIFHKCFLPKTDLLERGFVTEMQVPFHASFSFTDLVFSKSSLKQNKTNKNNQLKVQSNQIVN